MLAQQGEEVHAQSACLGIAKQNVPEESTCMRTEVLSKVSVHCLAHAQHRRQWYEWRRDGGRSVEVVYWDAGCGIAQQTRAVSCAEVCTQILRARGTGQASRLQ